MTLLQFCNHVLRFTTLDLGLHRLRLGCRDIDDVHVWVYSLTWFDGMVHTTLVSSTDHGLDFVFAASNISRHSTSV